MAGIGKSITAFLLFPSPYYLPSSVNLNNGRNAAVLKYDLRKLTGVEAWASITLFFWYHTPMRTYAKFSKSNMAVKGPTHTRHLRVLSRRTCAFRKYRRDKVNGIFDESRAKTE
jgi:hypothetical protein